MELVEEYEGNTKDNEYRRLSARLWHLYLRVERIPVDLDWDKDTAEEKDDLLQRSKHMLDTFLSLSSKVTEKLDGAEEKKASEDTSVNTAEEGGTSQGTNTETPPSQGNVNRKNIAQEKHLPPLGHAGQGKSTMVGNRKLKPNESCIEAETAKPIPVFKWGLQFSNGPGQSIGAFLQRVEELRHAREVSEAHYLLPKNIKIPHLDNNPVMGQEGSNVGKDIIDNLVETQFPTEQSSNYRHERERISLVKPDSQ
ncbi:hypothetical protein J6590_093092 [Homalodisca vitripennis]|nr:hypothetical protein J6590_093092 [Homalodisca vitripennis]